MLEAGGLANRTAAVSAWRWRRRFVFLEAQQRLLRWPEVGEWHPPGRDWHTAGEHEDEQQFEQLKGCCEGDIRGAEVQSKSFMPQSTQQGHLGGELWD